MLTYFLYKKIANQSNKYVIIVLHNSNYCYFTFQPEFQLGLQCTIRFRCAFKTTLLINFFSVVFNRWSHRAVIMLQSRMLSSSPRLASGYLIFRCEFGPKFYKKPRCLCDSRPYCFTADYYAKYHLQLLSRWGLPSISILGVV